MYVKKRGSEWEEGRARVVYSQQAQPCYFYVNVNIEGSIFEVQNFQ